MPTQTLENTLRTQGYKHIAGADEAGRGALAGPIVAAAVIMPPRPRLRFVADSKQLTPIRRRQLYARITRTAVSWSVSMRSAATIDAYGIQPANRTVLYNAINTLAVKPEYALIDGLFTRSNTPDTRFINGRYPNSHTTATTFAWQSIIKGDQRIYAVAAASIIAKVTRDWLMCALGRHYPQYDFAQHKGYGTYHHLQAILKHGPSPVHRRSFLKNVV